MFRCIGIFLLFSAFSFAQSFTDTDYTVGANPRGITSADFNRDGLIDIAVANRDSGSVSVLLGRGDGTFGTATSVAVASLPNEIVSADFNQDGVSDLAIAGNAVTILIGNGDGSFRRGDIPLSGDSITSADFNRDGRADLAVVSNGAAQILLGNGDGTFTPGTKLQGDISFAVVRAGDLNRDGIADLGIGACCQGEDVTYGAVYRAIGHVDGTFTLTKSSDQSDGTKLTVADVTADGWPEMILPYLGCHTPCSGVEVQLNQNGSFQRFGGMELGTLKYVRPGQAAVGNFSGNTQVAAPFAPGDYTANGTGTNADKMLIWSVGADGKFTSQTDHAIGSGYGVWGVVAADFNNDGKTDLAVTDSAIGKITVLINNTGTSAAQQDFALTMNYSPQTAKAGEKAKYQYVIEATNGSLPEMQLSCSGLPQGATCSFDNTIPGQITVGWLTVQTSAQTKASVNQQMFVAVATLLPFGFVVVAINTRRRFVWLATLLVCIAMFWQIGCAGLPSSAGVTPSGFTGGGTSIGSGTSAGGPAAGSSGSGGGSSSSSNGTTPAGTYEVTVSATGAGVTHTQTIMLNVQ